MHKMKKENRRNFIQRILSPNGQPNGLYGLAKVHKTSTTPSCDGPPWALNILSKRNTLTYIKEYNNL